MKTFFVSRITLIWVALAMLAGCQKPMQPSMGTSMHVSDVKRGEFLVTVAVCNDCHTPLKMGPNGPEPDLSRRLSGHPQQLTALPPKLAPDSPWNWVGASTSTAFAGPWGVSYAINLTPDMQTGIGNWNADLFVKVMKTGKHFGTDRPIMPPMPWQGYARYPEEDMKAIFAYLRSIPPIKNKAPEYVSPEKLATMTK